jgi:hypothetical protein
MITDKIDAYLNKKKTKLIKEDIDSLDVTESVIELVSSLDINTLDDWQLEMRDKILAVIDDRVENMDANLGEQPVDPDFSGDTQDPESTEPFEMSTEKVYADYTIWDKTLGEGKKKPATKKNRPKSRKKI